MEEMSFGELQEIVSVCLDEITNLKEENRQLRNMLDAYSQKTMEILNSLIESSKASNHELVVQIHCLNRAIENVKYEIKDPQKGKPQLCFPQICPIDETIEDIINHGKSMARFGDGEFAIMANWARQPFQHMDARLAERLREVIQVNENGFLIGIADNYGALDDYNEDGKREIRFHMTDEIRRQHLKFLDLNKKYHNAYISRPYAMYADNATDAPGKRFDNLKRIWEKRKVIFVEGSLTRLGVGNDLFDNAAQIRRIEAPPVHSFDKYDEILAAALQYAEQDTLFLVALGPAAGVLAYDLYRAGYQAIDIGHVDLEYEWYLKGTGGRCEVKNKYNNEFPGGDVVEDIKDEEYLKQIICTIK